MGFTYSVSSIYARVDNVRAGICTGTRIVLVNGRSRGVARDAGEVPGSASLRDDGVDGEDAVFFHILDLPGAWLYERYGFHELSVLCYTPLEASEWPQEKPHPGHLQIP